MKRYRGEFNGRSKEFKKFRTANSIKSENGKESFFSLLPVHDVAAQVDDAGADLVVACSES